MAYVSKAFRAKTSKAPISNCKILISPTLIGVLLAKCSAVLERRNKLLIIPPKCFFSLSCYGISSVSFSSYKAFVHLHIAGFFKVLNMAREIAIGYLNKFLKVVEAHFFIYKQRAHDTEANAAVKCFI